MISPTQAARPYSQPLEDTLASKLDTAQATEGSPPMATVAGKSGEVEEDTAEEGSGHGRYYPRCCVLQVWGFDSVCASIVSVSK